MENILIYSKTFKTKNGGTFSKLKASTRGCAFDIQLTQEADKKLSEKGFKFPIDLTLGDKDYFIVKKNYTTSSGENRYKDVIVIRGFQEAKQGEFVQKTLSDLVAEQATRD